MAHDGLRAADRPDEGEPNGRLDSWKEIAAYLKRDVTTVRRWEKREGLPVHRHLHDRRDSVYAYPAEVDSWWKSRRSRLTQDGQHGLVLNDAPENGESPSNGVATVWVARSHVARWGWALAAMFFVTTVGLAALLLTRDPSTANGADVERRFQIFPPPGTSYADVIVSPDGRQLAFTATANDIGKGRRKLWVQSLDSLQARELPDTDEASLPFWSPASNALGFFAGGHLWTINLAGRARSLAVAPDGRGGTWNRDGTIVFAPGRDGALSRVASGGGAASLVTRLGDGERGHLWPEFLPDGKHFIYVSHPGSSGPEKHHAYVAAVDGSWKRRILSVESSVLGRADGYLYYVRERQLLAQPFDFQRFDFTGEAVALADKVLEHYDYPRKTEFSVSPAGILTYRTPQSPATRLVWRDRAGRMSPLLDTPAEYTEPVFSPDHTRVAYDVFDPQPSNRFGYGPANVRSNIFVLDRAKGLSSALTSNPAGAWGPVWSPDGRTVVFSSHLGDDTLGLFQKDTMNPNAVELALPTPGTRPVATSWSRDGRFLVYTDFDRRTSTDVFLLPTSGDRTPVALLQSQAGEEQGQISPDGRWLAYTSDESGTAEVHVTTFPKVTTKWQISSGGAGDPRWSADGKELFYITENRLLMAVPIKPGAAFEHGQAVPLFDTGTPPHWYEARNLYDVSRDGRFLFMIPIEDDRSSPVTVVLNWAARLRK